jgi:hypothetical protein
MAANPVWGIFWGSCLEPLQIGLLQPVPHLGDLGAQDSHQEFVDPGPTPGRFVGPKGRFAALPYVLGSSVAPPMVDEFNNIASKCFDRTDSEDVIGRVLESTPMLSKP